jgi:hypothetical protein
MLQAGQLEQLIWFVMRHSPAGKNINTEAEDIVDIRRQATTGKDMEDWEELGRPVVNCRRC